MNFLKSIIVFGVLTFITNVGASQKPVKCASMLPSNIQITVPASCNQSSKFSNIPAEKFHLPESKRIIEKNVTTHNNLGASEIIFPDKTRKNIYRSAILSSNPACLADLVKQNKVSSIVNIYSGDIVDIHRLAKQEKEHFVQAGGSHYIHVLDFTDRPEKYSSKRAFYQRIAKVIRTVKQQEGNVVVHCLGGMHKTGVIFGIMQKCFNKVPLKDVIDNYKCHVGWKDEKDQGALYAFNVETIKKFPCSFLQ